MKRVNRVGNSRISASLIVAAWWLVTGPLQAGTPFNTSLTVGLPATVEFEQFDNGGQNVGYYSFNNINYGGKFRSEGVSIYRCVDYGGIAGYCVGDARQYDWLAYTVNNPETANYVVEVRARSAPVYGSCTFHLEWGGVNVSTEFTMSYPDYNWHTVTGTASLTAGIGTLKLVFDSADPTYGAGFFDYMTLYKVPPAPPPSSNLFPVANLSTNNTLSAALSNTTNLQQAISQASTAGGVVTIPSGTFYLCQTNPVETFPASGGAVSAPVVAAVSPTSNLTNGYTGYVGFQFTVGNQPLVVTKLGRWVVSGNANTHWVKLVDQNGTDVYEAGASISTATNPPGHFAYSAFGTGGTVTLTNNTTYYVLSYETNSGDQWYSTTPFTPSNAGITVNGSAYGNNGSYYIYSAGTNSLGPVSFLYQAQPAEAGDNYAALITGNNVTIQGTSPGTTLVAYNRVTTILYGGGGHKYQGWFGPYVTNIVLTNLLIQGNPTIDFTGSYNTNGIMAAYYPGMGQQDPLGSLVVLAGYFNPGFATNYSQRLAVQNCSFYVPTDVSVNLSWVSDAVITNCSFNYFTNNMPSGLVSGLEAWCAILSESPLVKDVGVLGCSFNGNASMQSPCDYAADGLVWLANGGGWIVENCAITNYHFEAVQLNAGPYTVVSNAFSTMSTNNSSCALNTFQNAGTSSLSSSASIYSSYCFVGNTVGVVGSLGGGFSGIRDPDYSASWGPYNLIVSANQFNLTANVGSGYSAPMMAIATPQAATVTGNQLLTGHRAIFYGWESANAQNFSLLAQCNDFSQVKSSSFLVQDGNGKFTNAVFRYNRLGQGVDESSINTYGTHIALELGSTRPYLLLQGNQFVYGQNSASPLVTSIASQGAQTAASGAYGCKFQVGNATSIATYLGRWVQSGNAYSHLLKLYDANGNSLRSASVPTAYQPVNQFAYAEILPIDGGPVPLAAGSVNYLVSNEGVDYWYDGSTRVATNNAASVQASVGSTIGSPPWTTYQTGSYDAVPVSYLSFLIYPRVGPWTPPNTTTVYQPNQSNQYQINNPSQFADSTFSLY